MIYYVYLHIKSTDGIPFYVGKGLKERAYSPAHRNKFWHNTVNKYGFDVILLEDGLTEADALDREKYWIKRIGRRDLGNGTLVNMTDGGDGLSNRKMSKEFREKCSKKMTGNKINKGRKHSKEVNMLKGLPMGKNAKAKKLTYKGVDYDCIKSLWQSKFNNISYSHFTHLIRNKKIIL